MVEEEIMGDMMIPNPESIDGVVANYTKAMAILTGMNADIKAFTKRLEQMANELRASGKRETTKRIEIIERYDNKTIRMLVEEVQSWKN